MNPRTLSGVSRPGEIVWSRVFIMDGVLHADLGRASAIALPAEETKRRLDATNPEWPIMHAVLAKAAMFAELGVRVHLCGDVRI